jgi:S-DNA-T family DNA segregation ATPase FtsK/SpoIIIE
MSILMRATPAEVRLILIDPKRIELNLYNGVPHLYVPVVTEAKEAASALHWAVGEMESRLKKLQKAGVRNIAQYNAAVRDGKTEEGTTELPYLVIIIDELADLMMVAAKEVEDSICRIAQLARAAGIHLIVATQRPSTDIITGLIKTNITNRIAFAVSSGIDSRVILDQPGAEKLIGLGDMLFSTPQWPKPKRIQGAFVSEAEIGAVVDHLKVQAEPDYHEEILHLKVTGPSGSLESDEDDDPLVWEAADIVVTSGMGSTSLLQRRLKVGYARAGRIMDMLESKGIVGQPDGSRPREVLVDIGELEALKHFEREEREDGV